MAFSLIFFRYEVFLRVARTLCGLTLHLLPCARKAVTWFLTAGRCKVTSRYVAGHQKPSHLLMLPRCRPLKQAWLPCARRGIIQA